MCVVEGRGDEKECHNTFNVNVLWQNGGPKHRAVEKALKIAALIAPLQTILRSLAPS
jgi:hypothetical protein